MRCAATVSAVAAPTVAAEAVEHAVAEAGSVEEITGEVTDGAGEIAERLTEAGEQRAAGGQRHAPRPEPVKAAAAPVAVASAVPAVRKPAAAPVRTAGLVTAAPSRPAERKAQAVAMLDQTLLSDRTLRDLARGARQEAVKNR